MIGVPRFRRAPQRGYTVMVRRLPPDLLLGLMDCWVGLSLAGESPHRTSADIYAAAREIAPMRSWGVAFLVVGLCILSIIAQDRTHGHRHDVGIVRIATSVVRVGGPALFASWSMLFLISALQSRVASFIGVGIYGFLAYRHSLAPSEPDQRRDEAGTPWSGPRS